MKTYSFIIPWSETELDQGTYAWAGQAESQEAARRACALSMVDTRYLGDLEDVDVEKEAKEYADVEPFETYVGANLWAAKDMLETLRLVRKHDRTLPEEVRAAVAEAIRQGEASDEEA